MPSSTTSSQSQDTITDTSPSILTKPKNKSLPPTLLDNVFTRLNALLPDWLVDPFISRQRQLMAMERKLQRKFIKEYRSQVKALDPILRERGQLIGRALVDAFTGHHTTQINYTDVQKTPPSQASTNDNNTSSNTINTTTTTINNNTTSSMKVMIEQQQESAQNSMKELLTSLDPLLSPVLDPFVEGIKMPINELVGGVESDVKKVIIATAAVSLLTGVAIGRWTAPRGGSGGGSRNGK